MAARNESPSAAGSDGGAAAAAAAASAAVRAAAAADGEEGGFVGEEEDPRVAAARRRDPERYAGLDASDAALLEFVDRWKLRAIAFIAVGGGGLGFALGFRRQMRSAAAAKAGVGAAGGSDTARSGVVPRGAPSKFAPSSAAAAASASASSSSAATASSSSSSSSTTASGSSSAAGGAGAGAGAGRVRVRAPPSHRADFAAMAARAAHRRVPPGFSPVAFAGRALLAGTALCAAGAGAALWAVSYQTGARSFAELGDALRGRPRGLAPPPPQGEHVFDWRFWGGGLSGPAVGGGEQQQQPRAEGGGGGGGAAGAAGAGGDRGGAGTTGGSGSAA